MNHKIAFREYGHGSIVVLLHGYGGSVMHWDPVVECLKDSARVVVPNLTHLYHADNRLLFSVIVEKVAHFIRENFPGEKVSVVGSSFGGAIAWGLAVKYPELIDRQLLLNPLMPFPVKQFRLPETRYFFVLPMDAKSILRLLESPIGVAFLKRAATIFRPDREGMQARVEKLKGPRLRLVAQVIAHFSWILRNEDWKYWKKECAENKVPSLMIWSKDDLLFSEEAYQQFAAELQVKHTEVWDHGGHILSRTRPEEVAKFVEEFLLRTRRNAA